MKKRTALLLLLALCLTVTAAWAEIAPADTVSFYGELKGDTYENRFFGIGCSLEGWNYYTVEQMTDNDQQVREILEGKDIRPTEAEQVITVLDAALPSGIPNVNVQVQNCERDLATYQAWGVRKVLEYLKDTFIGIFEEDFTDVQVEVGDVRIGEEDIACLHCRYDADGVRYYFKQAWLLRGNYMVRISSTALTEEEAAEVFSHFYSLQ